MTQPKVSVIVPVYNTEKYLERCIQSLRAQTLQALEILLVDDGSKDVCAQLCDALAKTDDRIRVIHKENGGLGFARNTGLAAATGEYVGFVDSDDYIEPAMYETLYTTAKKHAAQIAVSGICFVGGNMFGKSGEYICRPAFDTETVFEGDAVKQMLLGVVGALPDEAEDSRYGASVCKNIFLKSVVDENNLAFLSERQILSEDTLFMVDFLKCTNKAVGVPGGYYCYCRNEDSLSKSYKSERFAKSLVFLRVLEERIADTLCASEYKIYTDRLTQGFGRILCSQEIMHAVENKIPYRQLRARLKAICTCDEISSVLRRYPWHKLPIKQAVFACLMKYRLYLLQKWIVILRDR